MKKIAILGTSGYVVNPLGRSIAANLEIAGANTGNLVFQYATRAMMGDTAEVYNIAHGEDSVWRGNHSLLDSVDLVVMPAANHLRQDADWDALNRWIETIKKPFIVLGLGAQADKAGDVQSTVEALRRNASVVRMCSLLAEKSVFVGVRGEFSRDVALALGVGQAEVTGCPSFLASRRVNQGVELQRLLDRLRANPAPTRVSMVAEAPYNLFKSPEKLQLEQSLFRFLRQVHGTYIQQSGGEEAVLAAMGQVPDAMRNQVEWQLAQMAPDLTVQEAIDYLRVHGKVFFSALDWIEYQRKFDLCIGHRFHGNMAAIAADRLGVVISHDSRTSELVQVMQLPRIASTVFDAKTPSIAEVLESIKFDARNFDRQRARMAARWIQVFGAVGVPLDNYMHQIATSAVR